MKFDHELIVEFKESMDIREIQNSIAIKDIDHQYDIYIDNLHVGYFSTLFDIEHFKFIYIDLLIEQFYTIFFKYIIKSIEEFLFNKGYNKILLALKRDNVLCKYMDKFFKCNKEYLYGNLYYKDKESTTV